MNLFLPLPSPTEDWYKPGPKITEFHESEAQIRCLIGGRGCGKTTSVMVEAIRHCWDNAGAKVYALRKTQLSNQDTTLDTLEIQVLPNYGSGYVDTGTSLFKKMEGGRIYRLPSRIAVQLYHAWEEMNPGAAKRDREQWLETVGNRYCGFLCFAGLPEERYRASRLRGFECSLLILIEADQLLKADLNMGVACLRWKGADPDTCDDKGFILDSGVILDTNPPGKRHWIAEMEAESEGDPTVRFWHIPTAENAHNLPPNYCKNLERQYRDNPAMLRRMLCGEYADAFDGKPVLFAFKETEHAASGLPWPKGAYLIRGWDFGTTHAVVWSAYWTEPYAYDDDLGKRHETKLEYWWDLYEYFATMSDTERQCREVVDLTNQVFPFWNNRDVCSGVKDFCDIAGNQQKDTGSSVNVLRTFNIYPGWRVMGLQQSLAIYNRLLQKRNQWEQPVYQIDKECCPMLYVASYGGYRYPIEGEAGFGGDAPLKGLAGGNYDHIADASRYAKYNCLQLLRAEVEKAADPVGVWAHRPAKNPKRRWW